MFAVSTTFQSFFLSPGWSYKLKDLRRELSGPGMFQNVMRNWKRSGAQKTYRPFRTEDFAIF
jgi:hypothetical protein